jgi:uncharacterized membrane protein YgdD (TMEM256/DUF423 family)
MLDRLLILAGGLCGAAGVALSAAAAHASGGNLATAASFLLMHAPVFLAVGLFRPTAAALRFGAPVLLLGLLVFSGDLLMRDFVGKRLFPMAAPAGGLLMIAGWLLVAASALRRGR